MEISVEEWAARSRRAEVCGILGCRNQPVHQCPHCGNYYCEEHRMVIEGPGHQFKIGRRFPPPHHYQAIYKQAPLRYSMLADFFSEWGQ